MLDAVNIPVRSLLRSGSLDICINLALWLPSVATVLPISKWPGDACWQRRTLAATPPACGLRHFSRLCTVTKFPVVLRHNKVWEALKDTLPLPSAGNLKILTSKCLGVNKPYFSWFKLRHRNLRSLQFLNSRISFNHLSIAFINLILVNSKKLINKTTLVPKNAH